MRQNLPVTDHEYILKDSESVVSKTDLHGNITYVNQDFINISGYSEQELLGAPQNIVRHPDMPAIAFEDFWRTLRAGRAWNGLVKNRCKNGDYYWVEANVAPLFERGRITGYTSIRVKPARDAVVAAEAGYRAINAGRARLTVRDGALLRLDRFRLHVPRAARSMGKGMAGMALLLMALFGACALSDDSVAMGWALLGAIVTSLSCMALQRGVLAPLASMRADLQRLSAGDLSGKIEAGGAVEVAQVREALRILQVNLKLLVGQIQEVTEIVHHGAAEMAAGNANLSQRTEAQASSLQQTAASVEQLTSTVQNNAREAQQAARLALASSGIAARGGMAVGQVVQTMAGIRDSSRKVADIIGVIDAIAFQTNILALNAAVEAARAGEQGRGFAVVASEVRVLAHRSAEAAKEIATLIGNAVRQAESGATLVDAAGETMAEIVSSVAQATDIMGGIGRASHEQSIGIEQVRGAIAQMDSVTQQDAALVEQAAAAALSMRHQAHRLEQLVASFRLRPADGAQWELT